MRNSSLSSQLDPRASLSFNVDCGEGDADIDALALRSVQAINIALGGHAGSADLAQALAAEAAAQGVAVHLHPSYPDREHFGRRVLDMPWPSLAQALSAQRAVLPQVRTCKFHGALYNQAVVDPSLAQRLADWLREEGVLSVLTPPYSALSQAAQERDIAVIHEGFADRAMCGQPPQLRLLPRDQAGAVFTQPEQFHQRLCQAAEGVVGTVDGHTHPWPVQTLCIHGDGPSAAQFLALARQWRRDAAP